MEIAAWAVILGALAINYIGFRARAGTLTRQSFAGIRTKTTMASDEAWKAAHDVAWPWIVAGAWTMALTGVIALQLENPSDETAGAILIAGLGVAAIPFGVGFTRAQRAARDVLDTETA